MEKRLHFFVAGPGHWLNLSVMGMLAGDDGSCALPHLEVTILVG